MQLIDRFVRAVLRTPASLLMVASAILSRGTGLLRDLITSYYFGTSADIAAYSAAFSLVDLLYMVIIGGALGSAFTPVFLEVWERKGAPQAWRLTNAVVSWALVILSLASALLWVAAPQLAPLIYGGQGFDAATLALTIELTRLFLWSPLLLGLGGLAMVTLNARDHFLLPALVPSLYNLSIIGGVLLAPHYGIYGMAWGVVIGAGLYLLVQLPMLYRFGMRFVPTLRAERAALRRIALQMGPRVLGQAAGHISLVATLALAARLNDGDAKVAALRYAYSLMLLPYGIFSLSLGMVAFPRLARLVAIGALDDVRRVIRVTLGRILWLTLPAAALLLTLGEPLARLLFERGAFDARSLSYTGSALLGYALALPAFAASEILIRAFYALQRTWTPVLVGIAHVALMLTIGSTALARGADLAALTAAFSIANLFEVLLLMLLLPRLLPGIWRERALQRTLLGALVVSLLVGGLWLLAREVSSPLVRGLWAGDGYVWSQDLFGLAGWGLCVGAAGALLYLALSALLGAAPAREIVQRLRPYLPSRRS